MQKGPTHHMQKKIYSQPISLFTQLLKKKQKVGFQLSGGNLF